VVSDVTDEQSRTYETNRSICPFCGVGCSIEYAGDGRARGARGPVNTRGEICSRGAAAWDVVGHDERLTEPLVREGGRLVTATWEAALSRSTAELERVVDDHGPGAVQFFASSNCTNEGNYLFQKLARMAGTNNVDNCARLCHASTRAR
jgi:formate dehydrogenase major subunit